MKIASTLLFIAVVSGQPKPPEFELLEVEKNIILEVNKIRAKHNRVPLVADIELMKATRKHCEWMAKNNRLQHTRAFVHENIAMGQTSSAEVAKDWYNSPGHRMNMLGKKFVKTGVAAYRAKNGRIYWCQQFKRK